MQHEQGILRLGDHVGRDIGRIGALGFRVEITHPDIGRAREAHLEIGEVLAAEAAAEARHRRRRDLCPLGQFDDRGIDREVEGIEQDIRDALFGGRKLPCLFLNARENIQCPALSVISKA